MSSLFYILLIAFTILGCSPETEKKDAGRIAATVNGVEITQREVASLYERTATPGVSEEVRRNQERAILAGLVRGELLAQKAVAEKLDRSAESVLTMYEARRQVLAVLAEKSMLASVKPLSDEALQSVIKQNPLIFGERKLLVYEQVLMPVVDVPFLQTLNDAAGKGASLSQLVDSIKAKKLQFQQVTQTQSTDQMQPAIARILSNAKPNVPILMRVENKFAMVLMLRSALPIPLVGNAALQTARNITSSQLRNQEFGKKMKGIVDASKITYFGAFAPGAAGKKGDGQLVPLPTVDTKMIAEKESRRIEVAIAIGVAYTFAVLLLTFWMRAFLGKFWQPLMSRKLKEVKSVDAEGHTEDHHDDEIMNTAYKPPVYIRYFLFFDVAVAVSTLGYQMFLVWSRTPEWIVALSVLPGLLLGVVFSQILSLSPFKKLTQNMRFLPILFFSFCLVAVVIATKRLIGL
ncbi:MAG: EpsD family peptidyl-prolyl cis-trans isomerase [Chlorobium sp.]